MLFDDFAIPMDIDAALHRGGLYTATAKVIPFLATFAPL